MIVDATDLNGRNGFQILGSDENNRSGGSVSNIGDFNGDGIDDLIIGAYGTTLSGAAEDNRGDAYVLFGDPERTSITIDVDDLDGTNGFRIVSADKDDFAGGSVSGAGDFNGDGLTDIIIGAFLADPQGRSDAGESHIIFGSDDEFEAVLELSSIDGSNGVRLDGVNPNDVSGVSVSGIGDINGDNIDDVLIGASFAETNGVFGNGVSYVVFGSNESFNASIDLDDLDGTNGFRLEGVSAFDRSGGSVSEAGDFNNDGLQDFLIGAGSADPGGNSLAGSAFLVFGSSNGFDASIELSDLDGTTGTRFDGLNAGDGAGSSVSGAGDINGDGIDDIIIGAGSADPDSISAAGSSYVIFGSETGLGSTFDLAGLNGANGFRIDGSTAGDHSGATVSDAGDVNGDGIDDLIIGSNFGFAVTRSSDNFEIEDVTGSSFVVFGSETAFTANIKVGDLNGDNGFRIYAIGSNSRSYVAGSVSGIGDFNGDGLDDVIVGQGFVDADGNANTGASFVVFGIQAPTLVGPTSVSVDENQTFVFDFSTTDNIDDEDAGLTYSLVDSADAALFVISLNTGIVSFRGAPDFEAPNDIGADNIYNLTVQVTDSSDLTSEASIAITVQDIDETQEPQNPDENTPIVVPGDDDETTLIIGSDNSDSLQGSDGRNIIIGDTSGVLTGTSDPDDIIGTANADTIVGNAGNDALAGGGGGDIISGGQGADQLRGNGGKDLLLGNGGKDQLEGGGGKDTLEGGGGKDNLLGGGGKDLLKGGGGKDMLDGQGGKDTMEGGGGKDEILGGRGSDILTGGGGADQFVFGRGNGRDKITDFQQGRDKISIVNSVDDFEGLAISQTGENVLIQIANTRVIVENDLVDNFSAADFIF